MGHVERSLNMVVHPVKWFSAAVRSIMKLNNRQLSTQEACTNVHIKFHTILWNTRCMTCHWSWRLHLYTPWLKGLIWCVVFPFMVMNGARGHTGHGWGKPHRHGRPCLCGFPYLCPVCFCAPFIIMNQHQLSQLPVLMNVFTLPEKKLFLIVLTVQAETYYLSQVKGRGIVVCGWSLHFC